MVIRYLQEYLPNSSYFLFGPRQSGKSFLLNTLHANDAFLVNLLLNEPYKKYSQFPEQFGKDLEYQITQNKYKIIIVDEVQKLPDLLNEVHNLIMNHPDVQFILTGSSARKLKRKGVNLLAGRAVQRYLFPYIHREIQENFNLEEILKYGTLPAVYHSPPEQKKDILRAYTDTYLREEIQAEAIVRNLGNFSRFLDLAVSQSGELISFASMSRDCQIAAATVESYYQILEDTLIGFRLLPWRSNLRKRMVAHPKFYFFDLGIINAINQNLDSAINAKLRGHLFEQLLILETYRLKKYRYYETNLFFWRTSNGAEVDLLIEKQHKLAYAVEFKSSKVVVRGDLRGLFAFREDHPDAKLLCVADVSTPFNVDDVEVLPWIDYLRNLDVYLS